MIHYFVVFDRLATIRGHHRVNKMITISSNDEDEILDAIRNIVADLIGHDDFRLTYHAHKETNNRTSQGRLTVDHDTEGDRLYGHGFYSRVTDDTP